MAMTSAEWNAAYRKRQLAKDPELFRARQAAHSRKYNHKNAEFLTKKNQQLPKHLWLLWNAKWRAKKFGLPFDLEESDVLIPATCPVLGVPLFVEGGVVTDNSPTLDRLVPSLGYVKGNVFVISKRANTIKSNAGVEELEKVAAWLKAMLPE